ncbi:hypothetical protein AV530_004715 [Patagioenas fasciata monilis]|uniref:Uncharacterized protein n=1 Tax=Patagioenas fasciata monilis TaxID=372326 RepID=A0A1V4JZE4_PATFA|nr:hypothetical protein AV530_004715 [Patagioenas fasciata monilis]
MEAANARPAPWRSRDREPSGERLSWSEGKGPSEHLLPRVGVLRPRTSKQVLHAWTGNSPSAGSSPVIRSFT